MNKNIINDIEFISICREILKENLDLENWCLAESSDQFQSDNYCGGFDATEKEFCFSFYDSDKTEYWFQFPLSDVEEIVAGTKVELELRKVE